MLFSRRVELSCEGDHLFRDVDSYGFVSKCLEESCGSACATAEIESIVAFGMVGYYCREVSVSEIVGFVEFEF